VSRTKLKPQRIADFPKEYRDTLAHWTALRNLGFSADEIFFGFGEVSGQPDILHLQLQTQGRTFTVMCAQLHEPESRVRKNWKKIAKLMQTSTLEERDACYREHLIGSSLDYFATFVMAIREKGIFVPELVHLEPHAGTA